jgi:hypothetical protein
MTQLLWLRQQLDVAEPVLWSEPTKKLWTVLYLQHQRQWKTFKSNQYWEE